jgi:phosphoribosylformylglycinamidine cyclo-ligase
MIEKVGNVPERDMYNTFNMGVGMSVVVAKEDVDTALATLKEYGEDAYVVGEIVKSDERVIL